jgi:hypothetical protein
MACSNMVRISIPFRLEIEKETELREMKCEFKHERFKMMKYFGHLASKFILLCQSRVTAFSITTIPLSHPSQSGHFASYYVILSIYLCPFALTRRSVIICLTVKKIYISGCSSFRWIDRINPAYRPIRFCNLPFNRGFLWRIDGAD